MSTVKLGARSGVTTSENAVASRRGEWKFERDFDGNVDSHTLSLPHGKCMHFFGLRLFYYACADPEIFMRGGPKKMVIFGHRRGGVQPPQNPEITFF